MDLTLFNAVDNKLVSNKKLLAQDGAEWKYFIEFATGYFKNRDIKNPVVVEIGIMKGAQMLYYKELMDAVYVGIDCNVNAEPHLLGDSQSTETVERLKNMLAGRDIDLLFIDGNHSYEAAKRDYELFEPLTKHLIAIHDIRATNNSEVLRLWKEIVIDEMSIEFNRYNTSVSIPECKFVDMGIGVIVKE